MGDILAENRRLLVFIIISNFLVNFGFQVWQTLFNNFAVEDLGAGPAAVGLIQAVREIPGLLGFALAFIAIYISEIRIMSLSIILLGAGVLLTGQSQTILFLGFATFLMSVGFHFFYPCSSAVVLMVMQKRDTARTLGNLGSLGSIAAVVGTLLVMLTAARISFQTLYLGVGLLVIVGGIVLLILFSGRPMGLPSGRKVTLRRRYWLYYTLSFLLGSRRHIFTTFALYLLVREFHVDVQTVALLFLINSIINVFTLRWTGQLVGRIGERLAMSIAFGSLALIFLGYAYVQSLYILFGLFILDNIIFGFNVALPVYFQKIAVTRDEITGNLSVEQAIQHIAAITVPLIGGIVWEKFGAQAPFLFGVGIVLAGLVLAQQMRVQPTPVPAQA
jgi:predicted MFS family arabinose efflux permease